MTIKGQIKKYSVALEAVSQYFDGQLYSSFDDMTNVYWFANDRNLKFDYEKFKYSEDFESENVHEPIYVFDLEHDLVRKEEYTLAYVDNGCGDQFFVVLDNSKEVKNQNG